MHKSHWEARGPSGAQLPCIISLPQGFLGARASPLHDCSSSPLTGVSTTCGNEPLLPVSSAGIYQKYLSLRNKDGEILSTGEVSQFQNMQKPEAFYVYLCLSPLIWGMHGELASPAIQDLQNGLVWNSDGTGSSSLLPPAHTQQRIHMWSCCPHTRASWESTQTLHQALGTGDMSLFLHAHCQFCTCGLRRAFTIHHVW